MSFILLLEISNKLYWNIIWFCFLVFSIILLVLAFAYSKKHNGEHEYGGSYYHPNSGDSQYRRNKSSFRSEREDKQRSDQEGYRRGMEDAIFGDSYHYTRGVKGSDSYRNGYTRGYEENCWDDEM